MFVLSNQCRIVATAGAVFVTGAMLAVPDAGFAQASEELSVDVAECVELESELERFACYERRVEAAREGGQGADASEPRPAAERAAASEESATPVARSEDVRSEPAARPRQETDEDSDLGFGAPVEDRDEYVSTIVSVREREPNTHVITLENGQIWYQMRAQRYLMRPGQEVRLYPTGWGKGYRLTIEENGGFIQVERVR